MRASKRKVFFHALPAMLFSKDVVNLKRQGKGELRNQAVFASTTGAGPDSPEKLPSHTSLTLPVLLRNLRARDCMTASRLPMCR